MAFQGPQSTPYGVQNGNLCARVATITDVGRKRRHNEDNHLILPLNGGGPPPDGEMSTLSTKEPGLLLAVADGMGGHHGGEVASGKCVEALASEIAPRVHNSGNGLPDLPSALHEAVVATHQAVFSLSKDHVGKEKMGTTLTAALLWGGRADVAQVGDSRAYLYRDGALVLLTQDQTIGNRLRNQGEDPSLVSGHIKELLTQAVGAQAEISVVMTGVDLVAQDLLLLCSDGLYKVVSPQELVDILEGDMSLAEKASHLIARGNENGGPDNITVVLVEICPLEAPC